MPNLKVVCFVFVLLYGSLCGVGVRRRATPPGRSLLTAKQLSSLTHAIAATNHLDMSQLHVKQFP